MRWPPVVVAAWLFATVGCGVLIGMDAHFVVRPERTEIAEVAPGTRIHETYGCFGSTREVWGEGTIEELEGGRVGVFRPRTRVESYADQLARLDPEQTAERVALRRVRWAGATLFSLACVAPFVGLLALLSRRPRPAFRVALMLVAALAPLAALGWLNLSVAARESTGTWSMHATAATWWASVAWGYLALTVVIAWWRWPKRQVTPVDPGVLE